MRVIRPDLSMGSLMRSSAWCSNFCLTLVGFEGGLIMDGIKEAVDANSLSSEVSNVSLEMTGNGTGSGLLAILKIGASDFDAAWDAALLYFLSVIDIMLHSLNCKYWVDRLQRAGQ